MDSIHASAMGFKGIEAIASTLFRLVKDADGRFFISRVEKRYLAASKFFDVFFDSGENPAVPWTAYNVRPLRLLLCFKVATILTEEIVREFWAMLLAKKDSEARRAIPDICEAVLARVGGISDARSRQIVTESLEWCRKHPEALDFHLSSKEAQKGHMPNMVAFVNLLQGIEHFSQRWERPLRRITHDRQSQFEATLATWHERFSNASDEPFERPGESYVLKMGAGSTFKVAASGDSPGVQIADVALWLHRKQREGHEMPSQCQRLLHYVYKRGWQQDFSFGGVGSIVEKQLEAIMSKDLSIEKEAEAKRFGQKLEEYRQRNLAAYEVDGLRPYERPEGAALDGPLRVVALMSRQVKAQ